MINYFPYCVLYIIYLIGRKVPEVYYVPSKPQTAGENCAGPSCSNEQDVQQSKLIKVTFPLFPSQLSRLKRYLSSQNLPLYVRNGVSCGLRISRIPSRSTWITRPLVLEDFWFSGGYERSECPERAQRALLASPSAVRCPVLSVGRRLNQNIETT